MKTAILISALALAIGCGNKSGASASACAGAIGKGVDAMMAQAKDKGAPAELLAAADKLKGAITNRCTEDKWSADVIDCYDKAQKREDLRACRQKLPPELSAKLQADEMKVMSEMMGGMAGHPGMGGGMGGGGMHGGMGGGMGGGGAPPAPPATGSAAPAPTPPAGGSDGATK